MLHTICLHVVRAVMFNLARQPPDVISDTFTGSETPTSSVTAVGFRYIYMYMYHRRVCNTHYEPPHPILWTQFTYMYTTYIAVHGCYVSEQGW